MTSYNIIISKMWRFRNDDGILDQGGRKEKKGEKREKKGKNRKASSRPQDGEHPLWGWYEK